MKTCIVIGADSYIYKQILPMMEADGWVCHNYRDEGYYPEPTFPKWDLCLITMGRVAPVGNWWGLDDKEIEKCFESNLLKPFLWLRRLWYWRAENATVIWFSGSNPQKIMNGYAPYNTAKMAVNKLVEQLDHETPDAKFVAFGPGYVKDSPIHKATLEANWPNERIARGDAGTPVEKIWEAMKFCIEAPKSWVGGKNIAVSDVLREGMWEPNALSNPELYKLRRIQ